jgi:hypothetical protein
MRKQTRIQNMQSEIKLARPAWLHCTRNCIECNGLGWDVFNDEEVQRNDTCTPRTKGTLPDDDAAQRAANTFNSRALRFIYQLANGLISPRHAKETAALFFELGRGQKPHDMSEELDLEDAERGCSVCVDGFPLELDVAPCCGRVRSRVKLKQS